MQRYIKLPNGRVSPIDEHDHINIVVRLDLSTVIKHDFEAFLDVLSEEATGSIALEDISYTAISAANNALHIQVTGCVADFLDDCQEISFQEYVELLSRSGALHVTENARCPACAGEAISGGAVDITSAKAHQNCLCMDCHAEWTDTYALVAVEGLVLGSAVAREPAQGDLQ